ncbi:hypothetical protein [uncultured Mediterranean phage]|nr:hypothetical protein [uncultured Mediterranean phage]
MPNVLSKELKRRPHPKKTGRYQVYDLYKNRWYVEDGQMGKAVIKKYKTSRDCLSKRVAALERQVDLQGKTLDRHNTDISTVSYFMRNVTRWVHAGGEFFKADN